MREEDFVRAENKRKEGFRLRMAGEGRDALPVLVSPLMENVPGVRHCFTTRGGGVSKGIFESLNLSFARGDEEACVHENFRRAAAAFGKTPDRIVSTHQTHTANIRIASEADAGKGVTRPRDYEDVDGLVTDVPGLILGVYVADCVPVMLADPVRHAIGIVHSGWRGTAAGIGAEAVRLMSRQYGSKPEDLIAAVGPSICRSCYEVSGDVAEAFYARLGGRAGEAVFPKAGKAHGDKKCTGDAAAAALPDEKAQMEAGGEKSGKYLVDLWAANRIILENEGLLPDRISVTDICTSCNSRLLFSHRASHGKRGNLGAFMMLL